MLPSPDLLSLVTAATTTPVSLSEARLNARIDANDEDRLTDAHLLAATRLVEEMAGVTLLAETWDWSFRASSDQRLKMPKRPVQSITSITYYDEDDALQTDTVDNYYLFSGRDKAFIEPKDGFDWPDTEDRMDAITVRFVAGHASVADVPQTYKQAILLLTAFWFENRVPASTDKMMPMPYGVEDLVSIERVGWIGA